MGRATIEIFVVLADGNARTGRVAVIMLMHCMPVHRWKEHSSQTIPEQGKRG